MGTGKWQENVRRRPIGSLVEGPLQRDDRKWPHSANLENMDRQDTEHEYWFEKAFVADYLEVYPARTVESARNEALAALKWLSPAPGQKLLDLCCGAGRHSVWLQESQC